VQPDGTEVAKVLDFGIAKLLPARPFGGPRGTGAGVVLGTLPYMAPEQLRGEAVRPAWDMWALAVIAFEVLTGAHPFAVGGDARTGVDSMLGGRLAACAPLVDAPPRCRDFFMRALALDPAARPDSPSRFYADLEYVLA
jgi:eukaryotic-like serine/threonine-protein kinase